ncbi:hypothetical protein ACSVH2_07140 [Flavobacterium sp. RSB2_4_14]|uniref:hypothetical protein n=1 Tax=Flavobacterium sp. RSB2_4_14 TaxID=3447665 RepID=UPI003F348F16
MKKITFLVASVLMTTGILNAKEVTRFTSNNTNFCFDEPISFVERGIEFFVFPNGEFDFNTRPQDSQGDYYYKTAGKRGTTVAIGRPINYGTLIEHDSFGRVRRIGNTFINYDNRDRVNRIGTVYMRYNRFALTQIGGMQIVYNRSGEIIDTIGSVKGYRNQGYAYSYQNYYNDYYVNNYASNFQDDDYYYYKPDGSRAKFEDNKEKK